MAEKSAREKVKEIARAMQQGVEFRSVATEAHLASQEYARRLAIGQAKSAQKIQGKRFIG